MCNREKEKYRRATDDRAKNTSTHTRQRGPPIFPPSLTLYPGLKNPSFSPSPLPNPKRRLWNHHTRPVCAQINPRKIEKQRPTKVTRPLKNFQTRREFFPRLDRPPHAAGASFLSSFFVAAFFAGAFLVVAAFLAAGAALVVLDTRPVVVAFLAAGLSAV